MVPTLQSIIDSTFKQQLQKFRETGKQLEIGDSVLAQMSGYGPWPSCIEGFTKNKQRIKCYFYGSHDRGSVDTTKVIPFDDAFDTIRLINLRKKIGYLKQFVKGINELEIAHGVPEHLSSLRELESLE